MEELSISLEPNSFIFTQKHQSGAVIVPEVTLEVVHINPFAQTVDFYCSSKRVTLSIAAITDCKNDNNSLYLSTGSIASILLLSPSAKPHSHDILISIASALAGILKSTKSSSGTSLNPEEQPSIHTGRPAQPQYKYRKEFIGSNASSESDFVNNKNASTSTVRAGASGDRSQLKKFHTNTEALEIIQYARIAHSFQAAHVLETIVTNELERIKKEKAGWKVAGAVAGLALGMSDGFQFTDLFTSIAFSNVGGMAHEFASKEQREFLQKVKSEWLISQKSALEILNRLGPPRQRTIAYFPDTGQLVISNIHENPARGTFLVPLGAAKDHALGFKNDDSLSMLYSNFSEEEINVLAYQLYPMELLEVASTKRVSLSKASEMNPYHELLDDSQEVTQLILNGASSFAIAYKINLPVGSEY